MDTEFLLKAFLNCSMDKPEGLANIEKATTQFNELSNEEQKRQAIQYLSNILSAGLDKKSLRNRDVIQKFGWVLTNFFSLEGMIATGITQIVRHFMKWESKEMKTAIHISEVIPLLGYQQEDYKKLCETFGNAMPQLLEDY